MVKKENKIVNTESVNKKPACSIPEIAFFSTLAEQEVSHYKWLATLTPEQHLNNALINMIRIYGKEVCLKEIQTKELRFV